MRCDILTNWSTRKDGKCGRVFCTRKGEPGCAILKHGKRLLRKLKRTRAEQLELEKELVG